MARTQRSDSENLARIAQNTGCLLYIAAASIVISLIGSFISFMNGF